MGSCNPPKLFNYHTDKVNIYTSDCFIPLPNWRSCIAPPAAEYIIPMVLGPIDSCGKQTVVPMPQPLNSAASYCNWMISNMPSSNVNSQPCCNSCIGK